MSTIEVGELIYVYTLKITGVTEYGISFADLMAGVVAPPPEGARFDVAFEGPASGAKLTGKVKGVDYVRVRADGRSAGPGGWLPAAGHPVRLPGTHHGLRAARRRPGVRSARHVAARPGAVDDLPLDDLPLGHRRVPADLLDGRGVRFGVLRRRLHARVRCARRGPVDGLPDVPTAA